MILLGGWRSITCIIVSEIDGLCVAGELPPVYPFSASVVVPCLTLRLVWDGGTGESRNAWWWPDASLTSSASAQGARVSLKRTDNFLCLLWRARCLGVRERRGGDCRLRCLADDQRK